MANIFEAAVEPDRRIPLKTSVHLEKDLSSKTERLASNQELHIFLGSLRLLWRQREQAKLGGWDVPRLIDRMRADSSLGSCLLVLTRLKQEHPWLYLGSSLRTLQVRMGEWRVPHAEQVVTFQKGSQDLQSYTTRSGVFLADQPG